MDREMVRTRSQALLNSHENAQLTEREEEVESYRDGPHTQQNETNVWSTEQRRHSTGQMSEEIVSQRGGPVEEEQIQSISVEEKITNLENSLHSMAAELKNAIRGMNDRLNQDKNNSHNFPSANSHIVDNNTHSTNRGRAQQYRHDSDSEYETNIYSSASSNLRVRPQNSPKLPVFTGKEAWNIWFNRFEDVANRHGWSNDRKLDELLPRLQGAAGDFAFGQLSQTDRANYRRLCQELSNRFRVVETSKAFQAQFSHRNQKYGETVEEYAAELKMLYDKAHIHRDRETRREDLLRRFLDGLLDDKARFHVEFTKDPQNIDDAVYQAVAFQETKQRRRVNDQNETRAIHSHDDGSDFDSNEIARMASTKNRNKTIENTVSDESASHSTNAINASNKESFDMGKLREIVRSELQNLISSNENSRKSEYQPNMNKSRSVPTHAQNFHRPNGYRQRNERAQQKRACFLCGDTNHFKRECPKLKEGESGKSFWENKHLN